MNASLPIEIVDLILHLSLHQDASIGDDATYQQASVQSDSILSIAGSSRHQRQPISYHQAAVVSRLSKHHYARFHSELYRHVTLDSDTAIALFCRTVTARQDLGGHVRSLAIFVDSPNQQSQRTSDVTVASAATESTLNEATVIQSPADRVLSACPNATHLLLSCDLFTNLSAGLYHLYQPKEVTLVNVTRVADLSGIVTRHRDLTAAELQRDPRMQAILGSSTTSSQPEQTPSSSSPLPSGRPVSTSERRPKRSLSHLHLVNFDGRLLHHLATLSSLTHVVLTNPSLPETRPGVPGLSILPRSHLMLLLGSGNITRIVLRADLPSCIRLIEEMLPIEDRKLVFRPIRKLVDPLSPEPSTRPRTTVNLDRQLSALRDFVATSTLDLLAELYDRVRLHLRRVISSASSSSSVDPDTSRESSGRTSHGRSYGGSSEGSTVKATRLIRRAKTTALLTTLATMTTISENLTKKRSR